MAGESVAIIIPVYKPDLTAAERCSLGQCLQILPNYPIVFIGPKDLNTSTFEKLCEGKVVFRFINFADNYFQTIAGYNRLMLSPAFYRKFLKYKFILIHQLDAYVFKDELDFWCSKNYDYIGAPNVPHQNGSGEIRFLKTYGRLINLVNKLLGTNLKIKNVGNGGFSLRKTNSCYWLLKILKKKATSWGSNNEDGFFKYWGNLLCPIFNLPPDAVALRFAIEESPTKSLDALKNHLPFGCHAFEKYEPETWKKYIHY